MKNYYQILGIERNSNLTEIKKSYRKLAIKFHPDKNEGDKFFEDRFKDIQEAYETLSNETKKIIYEKKLDDFLNIKSNPNFEKKEETKQNETKKDNQSYYKNETQSKKQFSKSKLVFYGFVLIMPMFIYYIFFKNKQENQIKGEEITRDFINTFEGNINKKYQIVAKINSTNGKLSGSYYYKRNPIKININGFFQNDSSIVINEFDKNGNQTGQFNGVFFDNNKILGKWSKPNGNNKMDFILIKSNINYEAVFEKKDTKKESQDNINKNINSLYVNIDNHSKSIELKSTFKKWEHIMIQDSIFDYVTEIDAKNSEKMQVLYEKGKYPMISDYQSVIDVDYNNDRIKDYIINFTVINCVNGIGRGSWSDSFIFIKGNKNGEIEIDRNYTNYFKRQLAKKYKEKFDLIVPKQKNGFIDIPNISFYDYKNGIIRGQMFLELNNYYPPRGKFIYSFINGKFSLFDSYENLGIK